MKTLAKVDTCCIHNFYITSDKLVLNNKILRNFSCEEEIIRHFFDDIHILGFMLRPKLSLIIFTTTQIYSYKQIKRNLYYGFPSRKFHFVCSMPDRLLMNLSPYLHNSLLSSRKGKNFQSTKVIIDVIMFFPYYSFNDTTEF